MALKPPRLIKKKAPETPAEEKVEAPVADTPAPKAKPTRKDAAPKRSAPVNAKKAKAAAIAKATGKEVPTPATSKRGRTPKNVGPTAATENQVPEVPAIESEHFSGPQIEFGTILQSMKEIAIADTKSKLEIRYVSARAALLLSKKVKVPFRGCYTRQEEVELILDFYRTVPKEFIPTKWMRFLHPEAKPAAKAKAEPKEKTPAKAKVPVKKVSNKK